MNKNNRILIIGERFYPEEFGINDLALEWKKRGYKVSVLTQVPSYPHDKIFPAYKNSLYQKDSWNDITIYRVFTLLGYQKSLLKKILNYCIFPFLATIVTLFKIRKFDKVFVYQTGPITQAFPIIFLNKIFRKQTYIWTLDLWPDTVYAYGFKEKHLLKLLLNLFVKLIYKSCNHIFVSNEGFISKIKFYVPKADITFTPQWVPLDLDFNSAKQIESIRPFFNFTFAGNIGKVQNLKNVIKGFSLAEGIENAKLNIVGDGSNLDNLKTLVKKNNIGNVLFHGRKPLKEMPNWFYSSDILIISLTNKASFALTVPAKFQAYLASGKPIFSIVPGETAILVNKYNLGYSAHPDNIEEITKGFEKLCMLNKQKKIEISQNAANLVESKYNFNKVLEQISEIIFH